MSPIIAQLGTPAKPPKPRGKSRGAVQRVDYSCRNTPRGRAQTQTGAQKAFANCLMAYLLFSQGPSITYRERELAGATIQLPTLGVQEKSALIRIDEGVPIDEWRSRLTMDEAVASIQSEAKHQTDPDIRPYKHPIYWAGFQVVGW